MRALPQVRWPSIPAPSLDRTPFILRRTHAGALLCWSSVIRVPSSTAAVGSASCRSPLIRTSSTPIAPQATRTEISVKELLSCTRNHWWRRPGMDSHHSGNGGTLLQPQCCRALRTQYNKHRWEPGQGPYVPDIAGRWLHEIDTAVRYMDIKTPILPSRLASHPVQAVRGLSRRVLLLETCLR